MILYFVFVFLIRTKVGRFVGFCWVWRPGWVRRHRRGWQWIMKVVLQCGHLSVGVQMVKWIYDKHVRSKIQNSHPHDKCINPTCWFFYFFS
ncbi:hypothetical protein ACS0TY_027437 [Phlomoides rotata]